MTRQRFSSMQLLRIVLALGWGDFSLKYRGSVLGYLWSFLGPLVQFIVIFHIFRPIVGDDIPQYALYLFLGIILWEHFSMTTSGCMAVLHDKAGIIQKIIVPRIVLPLSVGWMTLIIFCTRFLLFILFMFALGQIPTSAAFLYLPLLFVQITALALGIGMALSAYSLLFKDIPHLWAVALQVLYWLTPIMYRYAVSAPLLRELIVVHLRMAEGPWAFLDLFIRFQQLSIVLDDARRFFLYAQSDMPTLPHVMGVTALCLLVAALGGVIYAHRSRHFLQEY